MWSLKPASVQTRDPPVIMPVVNFYDESKQKAKQSRKRLVLLLLSTLALVALVAAAVAVSVRHGKGGGGAADNVLAPGGGGGGIKLVSTMCNSTSYPEDCVSSLSHSGARDPVSLVRAAVQVAEQRVREVAAVVAASATAAEYGNVTVRAAMADCGDNVDAALDQLASSLAALGDVGQLVASFDDLLNALSGALTFQDTCNDGLDGLMGEASGRVRASGDRARRLISVALGLLAQLDHQMQRAFNGRQLTETDDYPASWASPSQRRLLQQDPSRRPRPDAVVAADGSGQFASIQAAVDAAPSKSGEPHVIYIKRGIYRENVLVPSKATNLFFVGDGAGATIVTGNKNARQAGVTTFNSATLAVRGAGFLMRDMTVRNTAGPANHQAVALRISADKTVVYRCSLEGSQDTLYAHSLRQFYRETTIVGTVDFIFGNSAAVLQNCTLLATVGLPGQQVTFTAQGRTDKKQKTGLSFIGCTLDATVALREEIGQHPCYLGRPWKLYSNTVFMQSFISDIIQPRGWLEWDGDFALSTLFYGEFQNFGPGAATSRRVPWSTTITDPKLASKYTVKSFIKGSSWIANRRIPFVAGLL